MKGSPMKSMKRLMTLFACLMMAYTIVRAGLKIGDEAPGFTLKNYDGKEYALQNVLKDHRLTVVMFIATECPVSNAYAERMVALHSMFDSMGVAFVGINSNRAESVDRIASHAKEHGFLFPVLKDEHNAVADLYGAQVTPEIFLLNPAGQLVYHGRIDDDRKGNDIRHHDLHDALSALLAGKDVAQAETKAFGCSIKRVENPN